MGLKEVFIKAALKNIREDVDISNCGWLFERIMSKYEHCFIVRRSVDDAVLRKSYHLAAILFNFLNDDLGGSMADYFGSAVANALYDNNLALSLRPLSPEDLKAINESIEERALNYDKIKADLKDCGFDLDGGN